MARRCRSRRATWSTPPTTSSATAPTPPAPTSASWARPVKGGDWTRRGRRGRLPLPRPRSGASAARSPSGPTPGGADRGAPRARPASCSPRRTGRSTRSTRDIERGFQFNTAIAAVMELVNEAYRLKDGLYGDPAGEAAVRFATATAASLLFPFAPHLGRRGLRGARPASASGSSPGPSPTPRCSSATPSPWSSRSTASSATGSRSRPTRPRRSSLRLARESESVSATSTARRSSRRSWCPGKLVNLVVR